MDYKRVKLGEVADITRGISYKGADYSTVDNASAEAFINLKCISADGFRWDGIKYYSGKHKPSQSTGKGDLLIANTDLTRNREVIGNSILVPRLDRDQICFSHHLTKIEIHDENILNKKYLYYYLKAPKVRSYMIGNSDGTTVVMLPAKAISKLEIEMPNLKIQEKIVHILSTLDQKIELINCENCTIENTLQSHFNNWIDNMKPIATVGLDEIAKYTNGLAMQKFRPGDNDLGLPVVKIKEMNSGISKDTERCTSELKEEYTVFPGDVLFAWSGTLCMKIWDGEVAGLNQHIFKVTSDEYPKWFYYFWTKKHLERFINIAKGKATTMGHIQRKELSLSNVLIPNEHELKKQDGLFKPLLEKIISNNSQRQLLIHLRDTILPKLMSGEINLNEVK